MRRRDIEDLFWMFVSWVVTILCVYFATLVLVFGSWAVWTLSALVWDAGWPAMLAVVLGEALFVSGALLVITVSNK